MKKSELKEIIKASMLEDMGKSVFDTNKPSRIEEFIKALDGLVDEYHAELYLNDELFAAINDVKTAAKSEMGSVEIPEIPGFEGTRDALDDISLDYIDEAEDVEVNKILSSGGYDEIDDEELLATVKGRLKGKSNIGAKALNLLIMKIEDEEGGNIDFTNEAEEVDVEDNEEVDVDIEKDVKIDDESVESDIEVKGSMPGESGDEVAVQSLLMKAQEEAAKLGDEKLTDQIGNTITYFTRAHVAQVDENKRLKESKVRRGEDGLITKLL